MTQKQKQFCREYLIDLDATKAAIRSGYCSNNAGQLAHELMKKPDIIEAIAGAIERRATRLNIKADRVLEELCKIAFIDRSEIVQVKNGRVILKNTEELTEDQKSVLSEVSETQYGISVKLHDKLRALELIGKHLGMFIERTQHSGEINVTRQLSDEQLTLIATGGSPRIALPAGSADKPA